VFDAILNKSPVPQCVTIRGAAGTGAHRRQCLGRIALRYQHAADIRRPAAPEARHGLAPGDDPRRAGNRAAIQNAGCSWFQPRHPACRNGRRLPLSSPHARTHEQGHDCPRRFQQRSATRCSTARFAGDWPSLEQSPFPPHLEDRIYQMLQLMGRRRTATKPAIAKDICARTASAAVWRLHCEPRKQTSWGCARRTVAWRRARRRASASGPKAF
jgi:hypothetical protein